MKRKKVDWLSIIFGENNCRDFFFLQHSRILNEDDLRRRIFENDCLFLVIIVIVFVVDVVVAVVLMMIVIRHHQRSFESKSRRKSCIINTDCFESQDFLLKFISLFLDFGVIDIKGGILILVDGFKESIIILDGVEEEILV